MCSQVNNLTKSPEILRCRVIFNIKKTESTLYSSWHAVSNHQMIQKKRQGEGATTVKRGTENSRWAGQEGCFECVQTSVPLSVSEPCGSRQILGASLVTQWSRICLLVQETWVRSLVQEDPTCRGATARTRQLLKPACSIAPSLR